MVRKSAIGLVLVALAGNTSAADMLVAPAPKILAPLDGATVARHVVVRFEPPRGAAMPGGMPGGMTGHRHVHLLVDAAPPRPGASVPRDARHIHFMNDETATTLELAPGRHTLQLVVANAQHVVDDPPVVSAPVTVTVK
jgi:hypothetical protein